MLIGLLGGAGCLAGLGGAVALGAVALMGVMLATSAVAGAALAAMKTYSWITGSKVAWADREISSFFT